MGTAAPVKGAVLCNKLAPATVDDPVAYVAERLRARGFTPHPEYSSTLEQPHSQWIIVDIWATPPPKATLSITQGPPPPSRPSKRRRGR